MKSLRQRIKRSVQGHKPIGEARLEAAQFQRRAYAGLAIIVLCLIALGVRFWILQVRQHSELNARSDANRILTRPLPPGRGLIYDRNGVLLAENIAAFRLEVTPEQAGDVQETVTRLGEVLPISDDDITRFNAQRKRKRSYEGIPLRLKLSEEEIARFSINRWAFPGVEVVPYLTRSYPLGAEFAHTVGYVGRIDEEDLAALDASEYAGTTHIGKTGIERSYEKRLHGRVGYEKIEVNADHRPLRVLPGRVAPVPGENLYLSIDAHLQEVTEAAFEGRAGAAVAIDPRNGEVLAMVSVPSFDPNLFVNGISSVDYRGLLDDEKKPLLNRLLRGTFTPGSTMKPFVGLAGLELGLRKPEDTVLSTGEFFIPGQSRAYRDDVRGGFGRVDLVQAIARSVNTYFYSVSLDMGIDRFSGYLGRFGFGQPTGIDLLGEGSGVLPSREWKRARFNQPWYPGETVIAGIGQGYWIVTPLQLANAVSTFAARGVPHTPHLLRAVQTEGDETPVLLPLAPEQASVIAKPEDWLAVQRGMVEVVRAGTARAMGIGFPYDIAGKTGTAERFSRTDETWTSISASPIERHQVLFECFTPADAPRIAVVVALEAGRSGASDAAPIARKMLDAWLPGDQQRQRIETLATAGGSQP
ncbi:MAG: penicillin-binding protein 2 [Dokdonella sp.]|uniref:penicillin-binding protein 2 n=1 Tax=Dokdonella sp. TaxID=2291710 RepID=UPI0025BDEF5B|nr:penicillin-binding protein 2 [Dokdonella sp.]MBZ0223575.1 penicillin-binding protein 2 [Dokdonella sp.]MCC7255556.1 penicillin-binding protein 2 [Dokdonella sp.]